MASSANPSGSALPVQRPQPPTCGQQISRAALWLLTSPFTVTYNASTWIVDKAYYSLFGYGPGAKAPAGSYYSRSELAGTMKHTSGLLRRGSYDYNGQKVRIGRPGKTSRQSIRNVLATARVRDPQKTLRPGGVNARHFEKLTDPKVPSRGYTTTFHVVNQDAVYAAADLKQRYRRVALLNPANAFTPGGGARRGAAAMEEDLCRRSALLPVLEADQYPLRGSDLHYTADVPFFRYGRDRHYAFMERPVKVSVITSAAIDLSPRHLARNEGAQSDEAARYIPSQNDSPEEVIAKRKAFVEETRERAYAQLKKAADEGNEAVVLTAFGCGAFINDPEVVARIYRDVINEYFQGVFKNVTFAVIDDHNAGKAHNPRGNHLPFYEVFVQGKG